MTLGSCCGCGRVGPDVCNIIMLDREAPKGFNGWECCLCKLPSRGAVAVVCGECVGQAVKFACGGKYIADGVRIPIAQLARPFVHDAGKHPGEDARQVDVITSSRDA